MAITSVSSPSARRGKPTAAAGVSGAPWARRVDAASTPDAFMDVVVMLSVLMFVALATGVGALVLQQSINWPR